MSPEQEIAALRARVQALEWEVEGAKLNLIKTTRDLHHVCLRLARVLRFVESLGARWFDSSARHRGRVWSRRMAPDDR